MATFHYRALQPDGSIAEGQIEASGRPDAFRQMEGRGLRPISLAERNGTNGHSTSPAKLTSPTKATAKETTTEGKTNNTPQLSLKFGSGGSNRISARMLENFTRLLSSLLAAGVPLSRALVILTKEATSPAAAAKWKQVHDLVIDGLSLAEAMSRSPETFPRV